MVSAFIDALASLFRMNREVEFTITRHTEILNTPEKGAKFFRKKWDKKLFDHQEQVNVIFMDRKYRPIAWECIHTGSKTTTPFELKTFARYLTHYSPHAVFVAHNHPSGRCKPSQNDLLITERIRRLSCELDVEFCDHVILTKTKYFSFRESGLLD